MTHPVCIFGTPADSREIVERLMERGRQVLLAPGPDAPAAPAREPVRDGRPGGSCARRGCSPAAAGPVSSI